MGLLSTDTQPHRQQAETHILPKVRVGMAHDELPPQERYEAAVDRKIAGWRCRVASVFQAELRDLGPFGPQQGQNYQQVQEEPRWARQHMRQMWHRMILCR